jgi:hypothetical protein
LLRGFAEQQVNGDSTGLGGVSVEQFRQQFTGGTDLGGKDETRVACRSLLGAPLRRGQRAEDLPAPASSTDPASVSVTLRLVRSSRATPSRRSRLGDSARQRRLGDSQALGGPAEVQLLSEDDEISQLSRLHGARLPSARSIPAGYCCVIQPVLVFRW